MSMRESATKTLSSTPDTVFRAVTDVAGLPGWNTAITDVVRCPDRLDVGSEWKVRVHALGQSWVSVSRVTAFDAATRRFAYRSQSDDGNPSYADWEWQVDADPGGSSVRVAVELNPRTFWRKHLLVKVRRRSLRREMLASLDALGAVAAAGPPPAAADPGAGQGT